MKFKLGDRVVTKKLGLPQIGTVVTISDGFYVFSTKRPKDIWFKIYPNWIDYPVYELKLHTPSRPVSFEEFINDTSNAINGLSSVLNDDRMREFLKIQYNAIPLYYFVQNPEEDLELME